MTERHSPSVTWAVGRRKCTLSVRSASAPGLLEFEVQWSPNLPGRLSEDELQQYTAGRDRALRWFGAMQPDTAKRRVGETH